MQNHKKDILFLIIVISIFASIVFLNYFIDPYKVVKNRSDFRISYSQGEMVNIYMKAFKNKKMEKIVLGSSDISIAALSFPQFYSIALRGIDYATYYQILKMHFDLHPETKHVCLSLTYTDITGEYEHIIPKYTGKYYNLKELIRLFISLDTTKLSVQELKNKLKTNTSDNKLVYHCYPKQIDALKPLTEDTYIKENRRYEYLIKIINLLKEKKVEYIFIVPPYTAMYLSFIKNIPYYDEQVKRLQKFLVENDIEIYNFAYVNKHTEKSLYEAPYLFHNLNHSSMLFGYKMYRDLYLDEKNSDKLCIITNKYNIDQIISQNDKLIEQWEINNPDIVNERNEITKKFKKEYMDYKIEYTNDDIPNEYLDWKL